MHASPDVSHREDGTILLPVILLLLLLATAAAAMTLQARTSLRETATRRVRLSLALVSDAAVRATALALSTASANRAAPPFAIDGSSQGCQLANGRHLTLTVQDEGGRVDLNKATADLLVEIITRAGVSGPDATALSGAITARRDGSSAMRPSSKLEARPAKEYVPPSGGFALADALDELPNMQDGLFDRLRPLFTVANGSAGIDPAVAAPAIRAVIPAKELTSPAFESMTTPSNHSDFTITAVVTGEAGPRFERQALLHLDPQTGPLGRFIAWDAPISLGHMKISDDGQFCRRIATIMGPD